MSHDHGSAAGRCGAGGEQRDPDDPTPQFSRRQACGVLLGGLAGVLGAAGPVAAAGSSPWGPQVPDELADQRRAGVGFADDARSPHVVVLGVDGLRPDAMLVADAPNIDRLLATGTSSLRGMAGGIPVVGEQVTSSGPGWSSILTGVWVEKHEVESNAFLTPNYAEYPHFFQRLYELEPDARLGSFCNWEPINDIILRGMRTDMADLVHTARPWTRAGTVDQYQQRDAEVGQIAGEFIRTSDPLVTFVHLDSVDNAGHSTEFAPDSPTYLQAISAADSAIGTIMEAVDSRPSRKDERWMYVLTTDHGGINNGHGGQTIQEREIPFLVAGDGVPVEDRLHGPGHLAVAPTTMAYLGLPVADEWGWQADAFGLSV